MIVQCIIGKFSDDPNLCFSRQHMFIPLTQYGNFYEGEFRKDTTHILFIDIVENVLKNKDYILEKKNKGVKIIAAFFDEARFGVADICIRLNLIDKLILFDKQYKDRFNIDTYISDYFLNENLFKLKIKSDSKNICYFGHNLYNRYLPNIVTKIEVSNYIELYEKVQEFNGVLIFDTGKSECGFKIIHHNKAKALEALMCGVNAYCQDGIKTINYNNYLKTTSDIKDIPNVSFSQSEIFNINKSVIIQFIKEIKKL